MKNIISLDNLLRSIHNSILKTQLMTEQQHLRNLRRYINEDGTPKTIKINVPSVDKNNGPDTEDAELNVPLVSLVPPTAIKIKDFKINFKVNLLGYKESMAKTGVHEADGSMFSHEGPLFVEVGSLQQKYNAELNTDNIANVTIQFDNVDPPEALLRINDNLVKSII